MERDRVFVCKYCGRKFSPSYNIKKKQVLHFCSKSCKTKFQRQGFYNKTQLEHAIKKVIREAGRYLATSEILEKLKISSKTLTKFNVSILSLNRELGMRKPKSMFEFLVGEYLSEIIPDLEYEKTFDTCISCKGYLLRFDFYSPSLNLLIEADGKQHKYRKNPWYSKELNLNDTIKDTWTKKNGIELIRIPYGNGKVNREHIHSKIKSFCHNVIGNDKRDGLKSERIDAQSATKPLKDHKSMGKAQRLDNDADQQIIYPRALDPKGMI